MLPAAEDPEDERGRDGRLDVARLDRRRPESNRCTRLCRPLRSHSATSPGTFDPKGIWAVESAGRGESALGAAARADRLGFGSQGD